jgi:hypothetical protein
MEKDIEQYLRLETKKRGGLALKFVSPGFTGVPDRIILFPGAILVFVETKDTGKNLRKRQEYVKRQLEAFGFRVEKIDSKQQAKNFLDEIYPA